MIGKARIFNKQEFQNYSRLIMDLIWPAHSLISGKALPLNDYNSDYDLWQKLEFIDEPSCYQCGFPFEYKVSEKSLCAACIAKPPVFNRARAAIVYDEFSKKPVLDFKHGGRTDGLDFFAAQMLRAGHKLLKAADFLIPVPLHPKRLRARRFNQSALLAMRLAKLANITVQTEIIKRNKNTKPQGSLNAYQRTKNVSGAFTLDTKNKNMVLGKNILLIDDVFTTGATLNACARILKKAGANRVDCLCLMRVVKPLEIKP